MTAKELFKQMMAERRAWPRGSVDWKWRTRAARKYAWMMRGIPTTEWAE